MITLKLPVLPFAIGGLLASGFSPCPAQQGNGAAGAKVAFSTFEAEASSSQTNGKIVVMDTLPASKDSTPEMEASGRSFVELNDKGDYLQIGRVPAANTLVLRHCIPDAPGGGGLSATLSLHVNGTFRQSLTLSSKYNWLYGEAGLNGQSNEPAAGQAHVFWDESRFIIGGGGIKQGDTIRLQTDAQDNAAFYRIDLLDLEFATAAATPGSGTFLSVTDFGANGNDAGDDTDAMEKCITAAKQQGKIVWMPRGTYRQSRKIKLENVELSGEGMWLTNIIGTSEDNTWSGNLGFDLKGDRPAVRNLFFDSEVHTSRSTGGKPITGNPTNGLVENVWVTHTITGIWMAGKHSVVRGCRIRSTYADGINMNSGASDNIVEQNHVRGSGDDGIAILSETERNNTMSTGNIVRFNTVIATWWGHNCDLAGGDGHIMEDNWMADNPRFGSFTINLPSAYPMYPLTNSIVRRNVIVRGGGNAFGQRRGAITIFPGSTTISGVSIEDNQILQPIFRGIHLFGSKSQDIAFKRNIIEDPGEDGIFIDPQVEGSVIFQGNSVRRVHEGFKAMSNNAPSAFQVTDIDNKWR